MQRQWADSVRERMQALGISNRALAVACGRSESTIRRWLRGEDEPRGSDIVKIAERLDEDPLRAFIALGWLPGAASDALRLRMLDDRLRQAILRQVQVDSEPRTPLGAFVDRVSGEPGWAAITSHVARGAEFRVQFEDHIELVPTRGRERPPSRAEVDVFLDALMSVHDGSWVDDAPRSLGNWDEGIIKVPRVLAARPPGDQFAPRAPDSILVIGSHLSGNAKVGSLLATALQFGFVQLMTAVRLAYGVRAQTPDRRVDRIEVANTLFSDPTGIGRQLVWTMDLADAGGVLPPFVERGDSDRRPFIIYCRPTDLLIAFAARTSKGERRVNRQELVARRDLIDRTVDRLRDNVLVLDAPQAIGRGTTQDQYWDEHVRLFGRVIDKIGTDWGLDDTESVIAEALAAWQ